jgi:hypothetical protein
MTQAFVLSLRIDGNAKGAQAALAATAAAATEAKGAVEGLSRAGSDGGALGGLTRQAGALEAAIGHDGRGSMGGRGYQGAAGAVGNLTAQFNDIGMMMMAGQNPLQLAIQQGTQISQVIGPMGATGAAKALGSAFMGMLSPISLLTLGTIAVGASLVQWLTAAGDEARGLDEVLGDLDKSVKALRDGTKRSLEDMRADFGAVTPEVIAMERAFQELRIRDVLLDAAEASKALSESMSGGFRSAGARLADLFGASALGAITPAYDAVATMTRALDQLGKSTSIKEQLFWISVLKGAMLEASGGVDHMTDAQAEFYRKALESESTLRRVAAATGDIAATDIAGGIARAADEARRLTDELLAAVGAAQSLASQGQSALQEAQLRLEFKEDPVKLAAALAASRFDAAVQLPAGTGPEEQLDVAIRRQQTVSAATETARIDQALADWQRGQREGGKASDKQRSSLEDLIDAQMQELAILRETDPVQKEMLKHREAMVGATDAERQMVEELIAARIREQAEMQALQEAQDFFSGTLYDAFEGLILRGDNLTDVLHNIVSALAQAALQATLMGSGPLAGLFGTKDSGGLLGSLFKAILPGKAEGGLITGPGSGTSDDVLIAASSGEFVMTAAATRRHRHLLEAMNAGATMPGFARGGAVGGIGASASAAEAAPANITIDLRGARGNTEIEALVAEGIRRGLAEYDRQALPGRVRQISGDLRRVG